MQAAPYRTIPLLSKGGKLQAESLVDLEDYELLAQKRWHLATTGYARRDEYSRELGRSISFTMHRVIMGLERGDHHQVDHVNRNRLDNRRANLRVVDARGQSQNKPAWGRSRFRGVGWDRSRGLWIATIQKKHIGRFQDEVEAALCAHRARQETLPYAEPDPHLIELGVI